MKKALFIYDNSEKNADLYYATKFLAPDPFIYFEVDEKKYLVMSDLEIDRAKKTAKVNTVLSLSAYMESARKKTNSPSLTDVIGEIFSEYNIKDLVVPSNTSFKIVDDLRKAGFTVEEGSTPFCPERLIKTKEELKNILDAQRVVFAAMKLARDVLKASRVKGNKIVYKGKVLTSEIMRTMLSIFLCEKGYGGEPIIVAGGKDSIDPHALGSGPLYANQSIIVDIFPKSQKTLYCGDATRTFCKGKAPEALKKMYAVVKEGQALGVSMVRAGVNGRTIHEAITKLFDSKGYKTGEKDGRKQGFFHGTGHSIGLEVHEEPARIRGALDYTLQAGNVMSVEPGLYYEDIGGVRIEDLVHVTNTGCDILASFPKQLEV